MNLSEIQWESESAKRIGEIMIVGPPGSQKQSFIQSLTPDVQITNQAIVFGQLEIDAKLMLFLYGLDAEAPFAWDLIANKLLGFIVLYNWYDNASLDKAMNLVDFLSDRFSAPLIVAADVYSRPYPIVENRFRPALHVTSFCQFLFCKSSQRESVKSVIVSLLDMLLEREV